MVVLFNMKNKKNMLGVLTKYLYDKKGGHRHIILDSIDDKHVSIGLTSKNNKGKGSTNYACETDILGTGKKSYMRRQATVKPKKKYSDPIIKFMSKKDYTRALVYGNRAKEKYINKKK